uniref:Small ribosomal subunit protein bS1c n=1 Tax=Boldia erythrosiphon TaxID=74908 RepID=A0A1Y9TLX8_9RHOD|nr:30S ribosomal protein S1 [Boldia erythrosiphon]ARO90638.1 30S ribosomal protein S1 [Boldia erythrosiphon]
MNNNLIYMPPKFICKSLDFLVNKYNYLFNKGDIIAGKIFSIESSGILVDIGAKLVGYVPLKEISLYHISSFKKKINFYETREFYILNHNKENHQLILSICYIEYLKAWERIKQLYLEDISLNTTIIKQHKSGLAVNIEGVIGFVPNTHIIAKADDFIIGDKISLKFLAINEPNNYLILSHRRLIIQNYYNNLKIGQTIEGIIKDIKTYGLFIKIGDITGLLHISEINKKYSEKLSNCFKIGNSIIVRIIHIDPKQGRIALSTLY